MDQETESGVFIAEETDRQWRTQEFFSVGVQQIQLRKERTEIWGAVAP